MFIYQFVYILNWLDEIFWSSSYKFSLKSGPAKSILGQVLKIEIWYVANFEVFIVESLCVIVETVCLRVQNLSMTLIFECCVAFLFTAAVCQQWLYRLLHVHTALACSFISTSSQTVYAVLCTMGASCHALLSSSYVSDVSTVNFVFDQEKQSLMKFFININIFKIAVTFLARGGF